ncbi:MAG: deoxyribonuclease V [Bacteroidota bacterium]
MPSDLHPWNVSPAEAIKIQQTLSPKISVQSFDQPFQYVAGADISFDKGSNIIYAGVVVLKYPELSEVDRGLTVSRVTFPYIPGLLSFRESPVVLEAWEYLHVRPDVLLVDGHGYAHPRRFGIACHLGLLLDIPTIGCAKTVLVGKYEEPDREAGSFRPLVDRDEIVGAALRTSTGVTPVYVTVGHLVDLESAIKVVLNSCRGYRIPEPTRRAHLLVNALRRGEVETDRKQGSLF